MIKQCIVGLLVSLVALPALAVPPYPDGCSEFGVSFQEGNAILGNSGTAKRQQVYIIENLSQHPIWLDHPVKNGSASAGWSSYLSPGHWAAIMVNRKVFSLTCSSIEPGKVNYFDCGRVTRVCRMRRNSDADFGTATLGDYWLAEDVPTFKQVVSEMRAHGMREYDYSSQNAISNIVPMRPSTPMHTYTVTPSPYSSQSGTDTTATSTQSDAY